jgi:hypothetical protein
MNTHYDIVWPVKPAPVSTFYWDDADWLNYVRGFRPRGYEGGEFDKVAYDAWRIEDQRLAMQRDFPMFDIVYIGNDQFRFDMKEGK